MSYPHIKSAYIMLRALKVLSYKNAILTISPYIETHNANEEMREIIYQLFNTDAATADHLIAMKKGGKKTVDNIIGLCKGCNQLKSAKSISTWYSLHLGVRHNFINQIYVIDKMSKQGQIEGYENWAHDIAEQMFESTRGKYDIRKDFPKKEGKE